MNGLGRQYAAVLTASTEASVVGPEPNAAAFEQLLADLIRIQEQPLRFVGARGAGSVLQGLEELALSIARDNKGKDAHLVVFLHCHGRPQGGITRDLRLFYGADHFGFFDLLSIFSKIGEARVTLIVDACFSGKLAQLIRQHVAAPKIAVLHSCSSSELAHDATSGRASPFTEALLDGAKELVRKGRAVLKLNEVAEHVHRRVTAQHFDQTPGHYSPGNSDWVLFHVETSATRRAPLSPEALARRMFDTIVTEVGHRPGLEETALIWLNATADLRALGWSSALDDGVSIHGLRMRAGYGEMPSAPRDEVELLRQLLGVPAEGQAPAGADEGGQSNPVNRLNLCRFLYGYAETLRTQYRNERMASEILNWIEPKGPNRDEGLLSPAEWDECRKLAGSAALRGLWITTTFERRLVIQEAPARTTERLVGEATLQFARGPIELLGRFELPTDGPADRRVPVMAGFVAEVLGRLRKLALNYDPSQLFWDFLLDAEQAHWRVESTPFPSDAALPTTTPLGVRVRCQLRLRSRHSGGTTPGSGSWPAISKRLRTGLSQRDVCPVANCGGSSELSDLHAALPNYPLLIAPDLCSVRVPGGQRTLTEAEVFRLLLDCGTIAALWVRPPGIASPGTGDILGSVLLPTNGHVEVEDWPEVVRRNRHQQSWRDVAFLYDLPEPKVRLRAEYSKAVVYGAGHGLSLARAHGTPIPPRS